VSVDAFGFEVVSPPWESSGDGRAVPVADGRQADNTGEHEADESGRGPRRRLTDAGNALRLTAQHGHRLRYVPELSDWLIWDGTRWAADHQGEVIQAAKAVAVSIFAEADECPDKASRDATLKWAMASEHANRLEAMVRLARSEPGIPVTIDRLDADPWVLNCLNGTVDLRSGQLRDHDPGDLITKRANVAYSAGAKALRWCQFLEQVQPDESVRTYLQRLAGYSLTGLTVEQVLLFLHGFGANGKSTFTVAMQHVLGDYARQADTSILVSVDQHPTGVADLKGARMVVATELDEGRRLAEGTVKSLTGGDRIKARFMRRDFFEYQPTHTLWLAANHRPIITGTDHGIWRRIKLVPFTVTMAADDQDHDLPAKLAKEGSGILAWAVQGCLDWQADGLAEPLTVKFAVDDYRAEMDTLGNDEVCTEHDDAVVSAADLYRHYTRWVEENGERPVAQRRFGQNLTERGFDRKKHGPNRRWHWFGISLTSSLGVNP
jgi:putative DNA primase/helicase